MKNLIFLLMLLPAANAAAGKTRSPPPPSPSSRPFKSVCDPRRYAGLNLTAAHFPFCDKNLPFRTRAKVLVDSMTLDEKVQQLGNEAPGVARLGVPPYNWWSEALHGVSDIGGGSSFDGPIPGATSFPLPITTTASFNETLWRSVGEAISTEARAMHNRGVGGLTYWSPNINVVRDPRWGRSLETPGEDPFVVGRYAVNFVRGMQDVEGHATAGGDPNSRPLKVSTCCKHYAAYDLDGWNGFNQLGVDRFHFSANVTEQDMVETFLRPFEMCVKEGDVSSVMCSYNKVNGIPTCADSRLLVGTVRGEWDLHGYIVSDCDSIQTIMEAQKFNDDTHQDAVAQVLRAGLDMDCGSYYPKYLVSAVEKGTMKESDIDKALYNNYVVLLRLGWFDGNPKYESLDARDVCSRENIELATDAARQGIVLMKNDLSHEFYLPLDPAVHRRVAVIGPHANATAAMIGNYAGVPCRFTTPLKGFSKYAKVDYHMGCDEVACKDEKYIFRATQAAKRADATVILVGLNLTYEGEGFDRTNFDLPGYQNRLIAEAAAASSGPTVLVVFSASTVDITDYLKDKKYGWLVDAIVWAGYPGEEGGQAIADVVFGKYNPGGKLPFSWYSQDYIWSLPMTSMQLRPNDELGYPGRTYKFYNGPAMQFPFGHGLTYSNFTFEIVSGQRMVKKELPSASHCHHIAYNESTGHAPPCPAALVGDNDDGVRCDSDDIRLAVKVTNVGAVDGSEVVMVYSKAPGGVVGAPIKQVVGFKRVFVPTGGSETASFEMNSCKALSLVTASAYVVLPSGEHKIVVGTGKNAVDIPFNVHFSYN